MIFTRSIKQLKNINIWLSFSLTVAFMISLPITTIWIKAVEVDVQVWNHIFDYFFYNYSTNTLILILGVSIVTILLGISGAWLVVFYDFYFRKILSYLLIFPIAIPPYAVAYCYADLTDNGGVLFAFLENIGFSHLQFLIPSVRSISGAIFILSITLFPYVYLIAKFSFANNSRKVIEAAANLGVNRIKLFFECALPLAKPAIVAGLGLVMMEAMSDFGVVHYLGVDSLSVGIYKSWFGLGDFNSAARLATILFIFAFLVLSIEGLLRKRDHGKHISFDLAPVNIKIFTKKSFLPLIILLFFTLVTLVVPFLWLLFSSFDLILKDSSSVKLFYKASVNSILLAFLGGILITSIAAVICFTQRIYSGTFNFLINFAKLGYACPGIVIAIGVITPVVYFDKKMIYFLELLRFNNVGLLISGSFFVLIFAYITRFLTVAFNPIEASYQKVSQKIDFAASNLGAQRKDLFFKIHIPMLSASFLIAFLLVFIDILKELPATLILRPFNFNTLSILTFEYASSEQLKMAAIPSLMIMAFAAIPLFFINLILRKKKF